MKFTDHTGYTIELNSTPGRIVSLVPSQTELLFDLGLKDQVVGITKFCVHPSQYVSDVAKIGGTKNVQLDKLRALQPDLIIANKEENTKEAVLALRKEFPVWTSDVYDINSALDLIQDIGELTDTETLALEMRKKLKEKFLNTKKFEGQSVIYLIWKNPWMTVGGDTYINSVLEHAGLLNLFAKNERYPTTSLAEIASLEPDLLFLSSEPYPFKDIDREELGKILLGTQVSRVSGETFSWYGSRMLKMPADWPSILD